MNTQATLEKMRQLKLTAMGQAYQAFLSLPLQEQSASSVSVTLAAFIEAEVQERQARKTLATVRAARFRYQASLEEIEYLPERNLDKHLLLQLWDTSFVKRGENLLITGATGSGKSFLATAIGYRACEQGWKVGYYSLPKLLQLLHWGLFPLDSAARLTLLQLFEDRHGKQATVITSQLPVANWHEYIGDPTIADAILDRLLQKAHRIELKGESMRKRTKAEKK
jgi:DNA replication protein DnaC